MTKAPRRLINITGPRTSCAVGDLEEFSVHVVSNAGAAQEPEPMTQSAGKSADDDEGHG